MLNIYFIKTYKRSKNKVTHFFLKHYPFFEILILKIESTNKCQLYVFVFCKKLLMFLK